MPLLLGVHEKTEKKMAKMLISSEMDRKERVGQQTHPAAQLVALAGRELVTERHLGSPRFVGESGTKCATLAAIVAPRSLGPRGSRAAVLFSGDEIGTRPLQFNSQFTNEPFEQSRARCLSTNEPPSSTIPQDIRGYDPGAAVNPAERPTLDHSPAIYNEANPRDDPIAHRYAARGVGPVPDYGACQEPSPQPTTRLIQGIFVHLDENIHPTEYSDKSPLPGTIPQGVHDDHNGSRSDRQPSGELSCSCEFQEATHACTVAALFGTIGLNCDNTQMTAATMGTSVLCEGEFNLAQPILASPHPSRVICGEGLHIEATGFAPAPRAHSATVKGVKLNPNAPEFIPLSEPHSSTGVVGVTPGLRTDQRPICRSQMTPTLAPSASLTPGPLTVQQRPNDARQGALLSNYLTQDSRRIGPVGEAREPPQAMPAMAILHINLVIHNTLSLTRGDEHGQIKPLGELLVVDSALFSYNHLGLIARVGKEWRQLAERGMQQLQTLSLPRSGNANLQQAKRAFSDKLLHIDLQ